MININVMADSFVQMAGIASLSLDEREMADYVRERLVGLSCEDVQEDDAGTAIGGNAGNLYARISSGKCNAAPLAFAVHLDTVAPGRGVRSIVERGIVRSDGSTVLGADCKSGVAMLLELIRVIREKGLKPKMDLEFVFTVAEEIGMQGARNFDYGILKAKRCFVLDSSQRDGFCNQAPGSHKLSCRIVGRSAHAGVDPENGINAIKVLGAILSEMPTGRIDDDSTMNIGTVKGGSALNVVPDEAYAGLEIRSFSEKRLGELLAEVEAIVKRVTKRFREESRGRLAA